MQAYLALLSLVLLGRQPTVSATHVLSLGMQAAISLGLHRKPASSPPEDIELRNRIWWTLYCHDRSIGAGVGRPLGISDAEITAGVSHQKKP